MTHQQLSMRRAAWILIGTGIVFVLTALPAFHPAARIFLQIAYWPIHDVPANLAVPAPLLIAISGGLTAGLGGMLWALATHVAPISPTAATKVTQIAAWSWFSTDSIGSVFVGAPMNVVLNLSFLALMLLSCKSQVRETAVAT